MSWLNATINIYNNSSTIHALSKSGCTPLESQEVQRKWVHDTYAEWQFVFHISKFGALKRAIGRP